uniref:Uncharacterized protein n=1 Tax=Rhizophora mucronata TaxID=61149 RepID=A0A2P2NGU0_RHIMU
MLYNVFVLCKHMLKPSLIYEFHGYFILLYWLICHYLLSFCFMIPTLNTVTVEKIVTMIHRLLRTTFSERLKIIGCNERLSFLNFVNYNGHKYLLWIIFC